jgi:hypothetical protein
MIEEKQGIMDIILYYQVLFLNSTECSVLISFSQQFFFFIINRLNSFCFVRAIPYFSDVYNLPLFFFGEILCFIEVIIEEIETLILFLEYPSLWEKLFKSKALWLVGKLFRVFLDRISHHILSIQSSITQNMVNYLSFTSKMLFDKHKWIWI